MDRLVQNLLTAYRDEIDTLEWMGAQTRSRPQQKLGKLHHQDRLPGAAGAIMRASAVSRGGPGSATSCAPNEFDYDAQSGTSSDGPSTATNGT